MIAYGLSDIGLIRDKNQDSFFYSFNENDDFLAVVCDGIGGGKAGDVASDLAVKVFKEEFSNISVLDTDANIKQWILDVVKKANDEIYMNSLTSRSRHGMGTTLVGILVMNKNTYVFHMGDSRLYAMYNDEIICLTEDHNLASDLVKSGEMDEEEASTHPKGKALTNALGIWSKYHVEINKIRNDYSHLLLCSDGLYNMVNDTTMYQVLTNDDSIENKIKQLIDISNNKGGFDNITGILVEKGAL